MLTFFKHLFIMLWALKNRFLYSMLEILVWIDIGIGLVFSIVLYIIFGWPTPSAYETISSVVGKYAAKGFKIALVLEWFIDRLFYIFEGSLGHCRRRIRFMIRPEEDDIDWENMP